MVEAPSLVDLCIASIRDEFLSGDDNNHAVAAICELPQELFNSLLPQLTPLALQKLEENLPLDFRNDFGRTVDNHGGSRKRQRCGILDAAWQSLYKLRWPSPDFPNRFVPFLGKHGEAKCISFDDWQQMYWEAHLQEDCSSPFL